MSMCLGALGFEDVDEDTVNRVMGAKPMQGASWEDALACAQHYGCRATLVVPATVAMLKAWTDAGIPIMIAWNPEGRDWSHASCVYDVTDGLPDAIPDNCAVEGEGAGFYVWVADPNIPNPGKTSRIVHADLFYKKWFEKWPRYLVRRPALAVEREITKDGRQVIASTLSARGSLMPVNARFEDGQPADPTENMTEEQRAEWWKHHENNKDKFKAASVRLASLVGGQARAAELTRLWRVAQSAEAFKARARGARFSTAAIEFCVQHLAASEETDAEAKFEEGQPADPTENMTEEQKKEWWEHHEKNKDKFKAAGEDEEDEEDEVASKEAAGGLYGHTKGTQRDVEAAVRKIERQAAKVARAIWEKDERVATFLASHSRRASSMPARILAAALNGLPGGSNPGVTAGATEYGLYGFPARTARLGLTACSELRDFAGRVAFDLHQRRAARYGHITGYLQAHAKAAKCRYSRLLLDSYPDGPATQTANTPAKKASVPSTVSGWLAWE